MAAPILYRKRLIPDECILLKDDVVLHWDEKNIITSWKALHPGKDFTYGYSMYCLEQGWKISKFYHPDHTFARWYCDIVDYDIDHDKNTVVSIDLLADVIIDAGGYSKVVDLDELSDAFEQGLLSNALLKKSLLNLNRLLSVIYAGRFTELVAPMESIIAEHKNA